MATLHPHWQATEEDERPVPVNGVSAQDIVPRATRRPAAIAGVAVFIVAGIALMQGIGTMLGQVQVSENLITVSATGLTPPVITVAAGETITWKNDDTIPHIFTSLTLRTADGTLFESSPVFPQSTVDYTVPTTMTTGTHEYFSKTSSNVMGQIIITAPNAAAQQSASSQQAVSSAPVFISAATAPSTAQVLQQTSQGIADQADVTIVDGSIPENPYTVGSVGNMPPARPGSGAGPRAAITQHLPSSTTASGAGGIVVVALISVCGLALLTRPLFRAYR